MEKLKHPGKMILASLFILVIFAASSSFRLKKDQPLPKELKNLKAVVFIPSGIYHGIKTDSFFMFEHEVTNIDYREFLYWLKRNGKSEELKIARIDTNLWNSIHTDGSLLYAKTYHHMDDYPVVNISREGAILFCKWLSEIWNKNQNKYIVSFRLPTKQEWEYAASSGNLSNENPFPWKGHFTRDHRGCYYAQHKAIGLKYGPAETGSYQSNEFGLYDMAGNASEMTDNNEVVKGGNWNSSEEELKITTDGKYIKSPFVGFRPVMTFKPK